MKKILMIQTAFIGDVVLSTAVLESLHQANAHTQIDVLVRNGNGKLFLQHPFIRNVFEWDKQEHKYKHWVNLLFEIRKNKYDCIINLQRFTATGLWTAFSGARVKIGFDKNPVSFLFTYKVKHEIGTKTLHEVERNHLLLAPLGIFTMLKPKLYPTALDIQTILAYQQIPYICIAPSSVWFTKQFPIHRWIQFIKALPFEGAIYIIGASSDKSIGDQIIQALPHKKIINMAGRLDFLAAAALQKGAIMNYVNDSAPLHFASAMDAVVTVIYCSTIPSFGFGPLSTQSFIVETEQKLACRPCGLHGKKFCPQKHFNCAETIRIEQILEPLKQVLQE